MKFVEVKDLEQINAALEFDTPDCHVVGGCDLYTTKAAGNDKKLYRIIDKQLNSQHHDSILLSSSASPPNAAPINNGVEHLRSPLSTSPMFSHDTNTNNSNNDYSNGVGNGGSLGSDGFIARQPRNFSNTGARLSASYTASSLGRSYETSSFGASPFGPLDQVSSRRTFAHLVTVLNASQPDRDYSSLRPQDFKRERSVTQAVNAFNSTFFGLGMPVPPKLWPTIDSHIDLKDCLVYSYSPFAAYEDPDEPGVIWSMMWFFFNKRRKRIAYLFLKAVRQKSPVITAVQATTASRHRRPSKVLNDSSQDEQSSDSDDMDLDYLEPNEDDDDGVVGDLELE